MKIKPLWYIRSIKGSDHFPSSIPSTLKQGISLEFSELDINYLDVNFFEDLLAVIQELDTLGDQALAVGSLVQGTRFGQDLTTQITTFTQDDTLILERAVTQATKLTLNISQGYTIILLQDGKTQQVLVNGGGDSTITITQGSG